MGAERGVSACVTSQTQFCPFQEASARLNLGSGQGKNDELLVGEGTES